MSHSVKATEISRVTRTHAQSRQNYDRLSRWYDLIEGGWEGHARQLGVSRLHVRAAETVLEIGCGTGSSLVELSRLASVVGLDLSYKMITLSRARLSKVNLPVNLVQADALRLPFPSDFFDIAFMSYTLELMDTPEISVVMGEVRRVLKNNGRLGVVSLSKLGGRSMMQRLYEWAHDRFPVAVDCRPIYVRQVIEEAGFTLSNYYLKSQTGLGIEVVIGEIEKASSCSFNEDP